jgi:ATP-dependent helicase HrpA
MPKRPPNRSSTEEQAALRAASVPAITYPPALPVSQAREQILDAIRDHQVVIVAGETGSGKTTQLPKMCLELGRGIRGQIGHTQPRRLAARTVAARIASELDVELGQQVGYQVRFTDQASDRTLVKLMTDGILLAEIQRDRSLRAYDTIIIDEAHERSLNIDFLLGYLKQLLPRRPDLKVIVTSATIETGRFSRHFDEAPVVEVSGRTYPVEVRYRPYDDTVDEVDAICDAVRELCGEGAGDVLVFLSGEREIRDTADALRKIDLRDTEVLPLYARLSTAEQQRVFAPHSGRHVVLATNVAETSLTVPGVRYVVDPGTARISRYSQRLKVQRLPIEPISQASANQRKGRCGRVAEGICIRLYDEDDFLARPEFTEPEILRTNLASVILQMTALGLGDIEAFPFLQPPDRRNIRDGLHLLMELGALDDRERLTPVGRRLARLPLDPRLARMVVEADRNGCLREVLVVAAALTIQDPRERPPDKQHAADEQHARFADSASDFSAFLNLWAYLREQQSLQSSSAFRRQCKAEFLHYLRVREWQDLHGQLRSVAKDLGLSLNDTAAQPDAISMSLLSGLLSHVGVKQGDAREFLGARGARFAIWPGSALARKPPAWVMAAELVETSRLWARTCARIEPEWAERLAPHLVKRAYSDPHWSSKRAAAMAYESVTLYGLPLVSARRVPYGRIDPEASRELFIRHALVAGEWKTHHRFLADNQRMLAQLSDIEHKLRRRDVVVDDEALFAFYEARVPTDVISGRHFDSWWKAQRHRRPDLLTFTRDDLLTTAAGEASAYPDEWPDGDARLRLTYRYAPGDDDDGVTVHVPLVLLSRLTPEPFEWNVPGYREELVTALVRSLPKPLRRELGPVPDAVRKLMGQLVTDGPVTQAVATALRRSTGVHLATGSLDVQALPGHLRMTFRVTDGGRTVGVGKDLRALQRELAPDVRRVVAGASGIERTGLSAWTIGDLPKTVEQTVDGHRVRGFPALVDEGQTAGVRVLLSPTAQQRAMWQGTRRLLLLGAPVPVRYIHGRLGKQAQLVLSGAPHGSVGELLTDVAGAAVDALMVAHGAPAWDEQSFAALLDAVRNRLGDRMLAILRDVQGVLVAAQDVAPRLKAPAGAAHSAAVDDMRSQLARLVYAGFVTATGADRLADVERYVRAIGVRLDKLAKDPGRDAVAMAQLEVVQAEYESLLRIRPPVADVAGVREIRWLIEELRVSLFAQQLGTRGPVSDQRIFKAIARLAA